MAKASSAFFRESFTVHQFITPYYRNIAGVASTPHRLSSYAMWILVIVENENVGSRSGLQWQQLSH
jgi:hypothetical protein